MDILVVDDNEDIRFLLSRILEAARMRPVVAGSGAEALSILMAGRSVDLVILDVQMPELDGWETLAAIRKDAALRNLRVLLCTVKGRTIDRERGWMLGCDGYVAKPFDMDELIETVSRVVAMNDEQRSTTRFTALAALEREGVR